MKLEVILAKLAANGSTPTMAPPPKPLGITTTKTTGVKPGAVLAPGKPLAPPRPGGAPDPNTHPIAAAPVGGGPATNTGAAAAAPVRTDSSAGADAGGFGGMMGNLAGSFKGIASGSSPEQMGQFMSAMGPVTKGVAGMGGLPAVAGMMSTARGDGNFSTLMRGANG